jgi:hypothetical protein
MTGSSSELSNSFQHSQTGKYGKKQRILAGLYALQIARN